MTLDTWQKNLKDFLKKRKSLNRLGKLWLRRYRARNDYPDWQAFLRGYENKWQALLTARSGPRVLVATSTGGHLAVNLVESLLAVALTLRGAEVHVLLCDGILPACMECEINWYHRQERFVRNGPARDLCRDCFWPAREMYRRLGLPVHRYGDLITAGEREAAVRLAASLPQNEIPSNTLDGMPVGEHALAGALRFFARGSLDDEPYGEPVLRRYFQAALLTAYAATHLLRQFNFDCAVFHHGIYVPQGLIGEVARKEQCRVVNWNPAYRKKCFIFSHDNTYHRTLISEPVEKWENLPWTPEMEAELLAYLKSRWDGSQDWIWFHEQPQFDLTSIARETGVDFSKPCVGLLTNVVWDAQLHYPANAFPDILDWMIKTIAYFGRRPDLQLLIRVHPAEIRSALPSRQPMVEEIKRAFPTLPANVFIIPPESQVSTYAAMFQCNPVIIYGTKTGVELTSMGIPVIVAGEAWIRNKGLTMDASSESDYFKILDGLPLKEKLPDSQIRRARKYAYHFFFRRMIPLEFMELRKGWPPYKIHETLGPEDLMPGRSPGLDAICEGILQRGDFILG